MSLAINATSLHSIRPTGLDALNATPAKDAKGDEELRQAFDAFVGETFYGEMIKSMHKMHGKAAYFNGGRAEEAFQSQLDQTWAQQMSKATANRFTGPMFNLFSLNRG